ncbi:ornithine cyclodeaminase [Haladaptatus paucihalophilus DX253]|uniref:Ornithine cyclodeaminase n=1 Tax=Haladaptatus paucihalophilus DX253 TaxID=797209 RepID=E7QRU4_HALPU|nr:MULTISPECIES: ornithine cyclodeaminase family protein [Haladaptatus]EFW92713.1 ornithine cyclodeaminase [Haladaptatus paucihalophilus DX253]GKZ13689.1 ornithine cyclodeaminase [Haladaptatus sp. T7]SHK14875.1 ornithine cyclodeaminase [Haladaptatus paucihalophilus DX253]
MTETLFLTSDDVAGLAGMDEFVDAVRDGYRQRGTGAPAKPRTTLVNDEPAGMLTGYSAILPETGAMGGYMYSAGFGAGDAWFMTPLFDAESGQPLALIDGASMNPFKTGAAGAVGLDALAREDATSLAIIGSGAQARGQLKAAVTVRDIETVSVFSPTKESRESFAAEMNEALSASVAAVASSAAAVEDADIVITATTASEPVFDGDILEDGTHVTAMGQYHPEKSELDETTIERSKYVPDLRERATQDAGSFLAALESGAVDEDHIHAELGEVVAGEKPGRESEDEITVFDSGGTGIETVASAYMLYEKATAEELGSTISLSPASEALTGE